MEENRYWRNGQFAVLVSRGFGAGWSTWASGDSNFFATDSGLVECFLSKESPSSYIASQGFDVPYMGGWDDIEIVWLDSGTRFIIKEYDGSESIQIESGVRWM